MSESIERDVARARGDDVPTEGPVVVGGGGGPERGRSPSGGEPHPRRPPPPVPRPVRPGSRIEGGDLEDEGWADDAVDAPAATPARLDGRYASRGPRLVT